MPGTFQQPASLMPLTDATAAAAGARGTFQAPKLDGCAAAPASLLARRWRPTSHAFGTGVMTTGQLDQEEGKISGTCPSLEDLLAAMQDQEKQQQQGEWQQQQHDGVPLGAPGQLQGPCFC